MTRIGQTVMLLHAGDREEARNRFGELWQQIGECGPALHRCTLAHYMADTQDDPGDELAWDLRALSAARGLACEAAFHPALHLNLAADYLKLQRLDAARAHLDRARVASAVLSDDPYGQGVRAAITRLEGLLAGD
ncbi:hypothetical protein [Streptomyces sp. SCSIO 30461]|uniref:hypothetical protein n=1 Tax=Streptomyces sp. SCSIO 30461 TaxID=3118085 RepID=UPI00387E3C19